MASFRTSSLFRFSTAYNDFIKILEDGIYPNYCAEDLSFEDVDFIIGIPMICFCDIPITLLDEHTNRYGSYGIGLSKQWGIKNGITPIMYVTNKSILNSIKYYLANESKLIECIKNPSLKQRNLIDTVIKDQIPLSAIIDLFKTETEHNATTHIVGYMKKYEGLHKGKPINNYVENEWRYIVPDTKETKWLWSKEEYNNWRFPDGQNKDSKKPSPSLNLIDHKLTFTPVDVNYILVKNDEFKKRIIDLIMGMKSFGDKQYILNLDEKLNLITKIITLDQVKEDF